MIKQKITAFFAATVLTLGLFAVVPTKPATAQTKDEASIIINFCKMAHRRFLQGDGGEYLRRGMNQLDTNNRPVVALACAAYGVGYDNGERNLT